MIMIININTLLLSEAIYSTVSPPPPALLRVLSGGGRAAGNPTVIYYTTTLCCSHGAQTLVLNKWWLFLCIQQLSLHMER